MTGSDRLTLAAVAALGLSAAAVGVLHLIDWAEYHLSPKDYCRKAGR